MREELGADYGSVSKKVTDLETAARCVISQDELIFPGDEYDAIRDYLEQHHRTTSTEYPSSIQIKLKSLSLAAVAVSGSEK